MLRRNLNPLYHSILSILFYLSIQACQPHDQKSETSNSAIKDLKDMVLIPSGKFTMGGRSEQAYRDEFPKHEVSISAFYMDATEVTNAEFAEFVEATGYKTIAERDINWDEMKKQLPAGTPKPADSVLKAGALVFNTN